MEYFFRTVTDEYGTKPFSLLHMLSLVITILGIIFLAKNKEKIVENKKFSRIIKYTLTSLIGMVIVSLYTWYAVTGFSCISESLPLYHCRLTMILCVLHTITKNKLAKLVVIYWGIMGGILAMLSPATDPFIFPHLTFFTFFVGHICMIWYVVYTLISEKYEFNKKDLKTILIFTLGYNAFLVVVNYFLQGNYGFLVEAPIATETFKKIGRIEYPLLIMSLYTLVLTLIYISSVKIQKLKENKFHLLVERIKEISNR